MNARQNQQAPALSMLAVADFINIGQLAVEYHRASVATGLAKSTYHKAIRDYECGEGRIHPGGPGFDELKAETATEYAAYRAAGRAASNIKRRLDNACRKAVKS